MIHEKWCPQFTQQIILSYQRAFCLPTIVSDFSILCKQIPYVLHPFCITILYHCTKTHPVKHRSDCFYQTNCHILSCILCRIHMHHNMFNLWKIRLNLVMHFLRNLMCMLQRVRTIYLNLYIYIYFVTKDTGLQQINS